MNLFNFDCDLYMLIISVDIITITVIFLNYLYLFPSHKICRPLENCMIFNQNFFNY